MMKSAKTVLLMTMLACTWMTAASPAAETQSVGEASNDVATCFSDAFKKRIEKGLAGYADVVGIPGVSIGVVASDALAFSAAVGYADRTQRTSASPDTLYNIASVTKPFTATLALVLEQEGVIELDAPVARYLPSTVRMPVDATGAAVTIRHLLSHSAGLPRNPPKRQGIDLTAPMDAGVWDAYKISDLYAALSTTTLTGKVGERFEYSNYGYALLGHVLERAAGEPFESLLRKRVLSPLGMVNTAITLTPAQAQQMAAFYWSNDPDRVAQKTRARYGEVAAHSGLTSSVRDLSAFVAAHLRAGQATAPAVSFTVPELMAKSQLSAHIGPRFQTDMGLGWFRRTDLKSGAVTIFHVGEVDGHTASLYMEPATRVGVIVLQNLGGDVGVRGVEQLGSWLLSAASDEFRRVGTCSPLLPRSTLPQKQRPNSSKPAPPRGPA